MEKIGENQVVTFRCPKQFLSHLKLEAHLLSLEQNEDLTCSDLIRQAVYQVYPMGGGHQH